MSIKYYYYYFDEEKKIDNLYSLENKTPLLLKYKLLMYE